jgi:hypothetical protein
MRQPALIRYVLHVLSLAAILAMTIVAPSVGRSSASATIRYRLDGKLIVVPVRIGNTHLWFAVDSGAPHSVVDSAVAKRLGLPIRSTDREEGAGRGSVERQHATPMFIELGNIHVKIQDPWILDLSHVGAVQRFDGLVGVDVFNKYVVKIDPQNQTLTLLDPFEFRYAGSGEAIALQCHNNRLFVPMRLSVAHGISQVHSVRIDTGSEDAVSDNLVRESPIRQKSLQGVGIGQPYVDYSGVFSSIQLGSYAIHNAWGPSNSVPAVGMEVLRRFVLVFDVPRRTLYIEPTNKLHDPVPSPAPN